VCSSFMTVLLWMWLTRILMICIQNFWQYLSNREYLLVHLSWEKLHLLCHFKITHIMESSIFIANDTRGKINCEFSYTVISTVWPEKISSPTSVTMRVKSACLKFGGYTNYLHEWSMEW
jgi:hypothetical protein